MDVTVQKQEGIAATFTAPPSKSYTHRALITGALARGRSHLSRPLISDDTLITIRTLQAFGVPIVEEGQEVSIEGTDGNLTCPTGAEIDVGESGTSMRFFTTLAHLCGTPVVVRGSSRMHQRPIGPLVTSLRDLGGEITYRGKEGYPPLSIRGPLMGGITTIRSDESSQFLSSLLLVAPYAQKDVEIRCEGIPVSRSYIDVTIDVMQSFGVSVERDDYLKFNVRAGDHYRSTSYEIEGDYSSASYFFALPAVCGGRVSVNGLNPFSSQGDRQFLDILAAMGCEVRYSTNGVEIQCDHYLTGVTVDMSSSPDTVQTLCVVASCATTPTTITGISHLRLKESDRLENTAAILSSLGAGVTTGHDWIHIVPGQLHGGIIDPHNDHRTAMSFAILGFRIGDLTILHAECVTKSFPTFWSSLAQAGML